MSTFLAASSSSVHTPPLLNRSPHKIRPAGRTFTCILYHMCVHLDGANGNRCTLVHSMAHRTGQRACATINVSCLLLWFHSPASGFCVTLVCGNCIIIAVITGSFLRSCKPSINQVVSTRPWYANAYAGRDRIIARRPGGLLHAHAFNYSDMSVAIGCERNYVTAEMLWRTWRRRRRRRTRLRLSVMGVVRGQSWTLVFFSAGIPPVAFCWLLRCEFVCVSVSTARLARWPRRT